MSEHNLQPVIAAVAAQGFRPRLTADGLDLVGGLLVGKLTVPLEIRFGDTSLAEAPRFTLPDTSMLGRKVVPHVDETGDFCVVDRRAYVFDRFKAAEHTLGLIVRAAEVLERGMTKAGTADIADEFPSYWSSSQIELDDASADAGKDNSRANLAHVTTHARLSFAPDQDRPITLGDLLDWASRWDRDLGGRVVATLARLSANDPTVAIDAPNGSVVAQVKVSARGSKFLEALRRPEGWKRFIGSGAARALPIERHRAGRRDIASLLAPNGEGGRAPLAGRRVVQIGCGAIGGYLARALAQLGAGVDAPFTLVDSDRLDRTNVRRHLLGLGDVLRPKAEACAEAIGRDLPGVDVRPVVAAAQSRQDLLGEVDLVIDATGEQEFGDWLNLWALRRRASSQKCPVLLFTWIAGHGWATQSFLVINGQRACLRCLQPHLSQPGRFDPLRDPVPEPVVACGDQPVTPYGPAAPMAAASLAAAHAADWALGRSPHLLRTARLDWGRTVKRDPRTPERTPQCPACGGA